MPKTSTPSVIRAVCRNMFYEELGTLQGLIWDDDVRAADKIKAMELLAKYGLGAADQAHIHVHAEAGSVVGVVAMPMLGEADDIAAEVGAITEAVEVVGGVEVAGALPRGADDARVDDVSPLEA